MTIRIKTATPADTPIILQLIRELAEFERLLHEVQATEEQLREQLFGARPGAEVLIARMDDEVAGFALFFHNFSTFLTKKGLYLEDLYVKQAHRGKGYGRQMLMALARIAVQRECGRFEWSVLDWNENAIRFYEGMGADVLPDWRICRVTGDALTQLAASKG
jgi:GNAT superfamily N-acetyltransferase